MFILSKGILESFWTKLGYQSKLSPLVLTLSLSSFWKLLNLGLKTWLSLQKLYISTFFVDLVTFFELRLFSQASPRISVKLISIRNLPFELNFFPAMGAQPQEFGSKFAIFYHRHLLMVISSLKEGSKFAVLSESR